MSTWPCQSSPTRSKANCRNSRTVWDSPVAITKSSGSSRWSIIHIASTYLGRAAPVSLGVEVAEAQLGLHDRLGGADGPRDLAGHERLPPSDRRVVEQDPVAGEQVVRLPIVHRRPVREPLETRYGLRGWNGVNSLCGGGAEPYISEDDAW